MVRAICGVHVRYRERDGNFEDRYLWWEQYLEYMSDTGKEMGILSTEIYGGSNMWTTCQIQEKIWEFEDRDLW